MGQAIFWVLAALNLAGLAVCFVDKRRAKRKAWRVRERTIFLFALLGVGWGVWGGMYLFRHKTRHWYFVIGIPAVTLAEYGFLTWFLLRR